MSIYKHTNISRHYWRYIIAIALLFSLSACFTVSFHHPTSDNSAQISLIDLAIYDNRDFNSYVDIVGLPRNMPIYKKTLPLHHRIYINELFNPAVKWLSEYDFNNDNAISKGELTQAWLVRTASLILDEELTADSLFKKPDGDPLASSDKLKPVNGLRISTNQEQYIRDIIDDAISDISDEEDEDNKILESTKFTIKFIDKMNQRKERELNNQRSNSDNNSQQETGNPNSGERDNDGGNNFGNDDDDNDDGGGDDFGGRQFSGSAN